MLRISHVVAGVLIACSLFYMHVETINLRHDIRYARQEKSITWLADRNSVMQRELNEYTFARVQDQLIRESEEYQVVNTFVRKFKDPVVPDSFIDIIVKAILASARKHDMDPRLIAAVMKTESSFVPWAVSSADCRGLMQLNPRVWKMNEYFEIGENVDKGTEVLKLYIAEFGLQAGLSAYNQGPGMQKAGYHQELYVDRVLTFFDRMSKMRV